MKVFVYGTLTPDGGAWELSEIDASRKVR
jgi:hypothetical protein